MRILAISHEYPPIGGGGANAAYNLLNGFCKEGHDVTLVTTAWNERKKSEAEHNAKSIEATEQKSANRLIIEEVDSKRLNADTSSFMEMLDFLFKAFHEANSLVREAKRDGTPYNVVLTFFGIPSGPIGYMLKKRYGLPYVIRFGGGDIPGAQKRFELIYKILKPVIRCVWRNADARITNSEGLTQRAEGFYPGLKYEIVCNGVDTDKFIPNAKESSSGTSLGEEDAIQLLFVSRLIKGKGLQYIIPDLKRIKESTGRLINLVVVGDGPYKENLLQLSEEYGVTDCIEFVGKKTGDELVALYQNSDIFVLPSEREGMPNVVLEAMACGLPVVMTPCQGSKELIEGNGYISDIDGIADKIAELISNTIMREEMGNRSRARAINLFSWNSAIDTYIGILRKVLMESRL